MALFVVIILLKQKKNLYHVVKLDEALSKLIEIEHLS